MRLKKTYKTIGDFYDSMVKLYPQKSRQIDKVLLNLLDLIDNLVYEDIPENVDRWHAWNESVKSYSIVMRCRKVKRTCDSKNVNKEKLFKEIVDIYVQLKSFQWLITGARRGLNSLIHEMEKKEFPDFDPVKHYHEVMKKGKSK